MTGTFRNPRTWESEKVVSVVEYTLPFGGDLSTSGSVTIGEFIGDRYERYLFLLDEFPDEMFVVGETTNTYDGSTMSTFNVYPWQKMLDGYFKWSGQRHDYSNIPYGHLMDGRIYDYLSNRCKSELCPEFVNKVEDPIPQDMEDYLSGCPVDESAYTEMNTTGGTVYAVFNLAQYLIGLERYGVKQTPRYELLTNAMETSGMKYSCLVLSNPFFCYDRNTVTPVYFHDGHTELTSFSISNDRISSVIAAVTFTRSNTVHVELHTFALQEDGSLQVDDNITGQVKGNSVLITKEYGSTSKTDATILSELRALAEEEFAKNSVKHKADFYSDKRYYMGQPVRLIFDGFQFDTAISRITVQSGDKRYRYECGDMPANTADMIRANGWAYGKRLPTHPRKGDLVLL